MYLRIDVYEILSVQLFQMFVYEERFHQIVESN